MKKIKRAQKTIITISIIVILCLLSIIVYYLKEKSDEIKTGTYVLSQDNIQDWSRIELREDNTYTFNRGLGISCRPSGVFYRKDQELYLEVNGIVDYIFDIKKNTLYLKECTEEFLLNKTWTYKKGY